MVMLPFVVGFWLLFRGISVIANSTDLKESGVQGWGWIMAFGVLMTILSFFIVMKPVIGAFYLVYLTAFSMIFMGIAYIMFSFKLKEIKSKTLDVAKNVKGGLEELKKAVIGHLQDVDQATKDKIGKMFDEYQ
jgi:glucan phosphoethanolaminetransferase (alkaline phosphatase superfamily)